MAYSLDLRERVVGDVKAGGKISKAVKIYKSRKSIDRQMAK
jgi:hypothetical protein